MADPATKWEIADQHQQRLPRSASANPICAFVMPALRLIDTPSASPKGHYVNPPTRGFSRMPKERGSRRAFPFRRQRRLAGHPGDGPQPGSLDGAHRSGRAGGNHQDPPAAVLLPRRTAHPLGAPPHFASAPALALGSRVQWRPGTIARPAISCLTAARLPLTRHPANCTSPPTRANPVREGHSLPTAYRLCPPSACLGAYLTPPSSPFIGIRLGPFTFPYPSSLVSTPVPITSVDSGLAPR